jgi:hypothetical protein
MKYQLTKTNLVFNWQENMDKLPYFPCQDYDLKDAITACSIKSSSGKIEDLYKSNILDIPENYKYTKLIQIPFINKLVSFFEFETTRIRIFKQDPKDITPMHIDKDDNNIVRLWVALNEDPLFKFYFGKEKEEIILEKGSILVFNPNYLHGAANLSDNKTRYTLNICGIPNNWLKNLVNSKEIRYINV